MKNFLTAFLKPFFDIRPGERMKTLLMFLYFMLVIMTIYILKPLRNALFIDDFGADKMKYMNVAEGLFLVVVVWGYSWLGKKMPHRLFDAAMTLFLIFNLGFFWFFSNQESVFISAFFFLWQATFSVILTTQFWIFANDLYSQNEAKRLFGLIISGGSIGGILGGWATQALLQVTAIHNLFLVVSGILAACLFLSMILWKEVRQKQNVPFLETPTVPLPEAQKPLRVTSYLLLVAGLVILAKMTSTIVENQFAGVVEQMVEGKQALASFYGGFYAWLNLLSFLMQFLMTATFLRRFGALGSIWILPVGLAILSVWNLCAVSLVAAVIYRLYDGSMNYSIQQASKEILYLPLSSAERRQAKPWIDMLGFRGAKTLAGLFMIAGTFLFQISAPQMGLLVLVLIPFWLMVLVGLRKKLQPLVQL